MKSNRIFLDTSALYAINDKNDKNNNKAVKIYREIVENNYQLILTDHIISETATLLRRRLGYKVAINFLETVEEGEAVGLFKIFYTNSSTMKVASSIFTKLALEKLSFVDAISFAVMAKTDTKLAFAYDKHFLSAGFSIVD